MWMVYIGLCRTTVSTSRVTHCYSKVKKSKHQTVTIFNQCDISNHTLSYFPTTIINQKYKFVDIFNNHHFETRYYPKTIWLRIISRSTCVQNNKSLFGKSVG